MTPGNLLLNRNRAEILAGSHLIAGVHYRVHSRMQHVHGAFDDCDARSLDAGIHRKHCAGDGDAAIGSLDVEVAGAALRRPNDHGAIVICCSRAPR